MSISLLALTIVGPNTQTAKSTPTSVTPQIMPGSIQVDEEFKGAKYQIQGAQISTQSVTVTKVPQNNHEVISPDAAPKLLPEKNSTQPVTVTKDTQRKPACIYIFTEIPNGPDYSYVYNAKNCTLYTFQRKLAL